MDTRPLLSLCLANLKPGTAKTTTSVGLAYAFFDLGIPVLLVDVDRAASAVAWSDVIGEGGFPFPITALPSADAGRRAPALAEPGAVIIYDTPQMEDHAAFVRGVMASVDEITVPVGTSGIELERMSAIWPYVDEVQAMRTTPARVSVLLNRVDARARSGTLARGVLADGKGYDVLTTEIPHRERLVRAFGDHLPSSEMPAFAALADEYLKRTETPTP